MTWFSKQDKEAIGIRRFLDEKYFSVEYFNYTLNSFKSSYGEMVYERLVADEGFIAIKKSLESVFG